MKILVTGNMGYVGSVLTYNLAKEFTGAELIGYDTGYFGQVLTAVDVYPECHLNTQYYRDVRDITREVLAEVDAVVHLAAVSNDPMGNEFEHVTISTNRQASVKLVKLAAETGVKNFVFASSCSMYGRADGGAVVETDPLNPLTAYARSKVGVEQDVKQLDLKKMVFTSLRFATACGWSPRLRLDLVLNDFIACALASKKISVLSDGSPWRPLIDVEDMSRAIIWGILRKSGAEGQFLAINVGSNENNFQVKDLAEAVARKVPGTDISVNPDALPDRRSYSVDFSLYEKLAPTFQPKVSLADSIDRMVLGLSTIKFQDKDFRNSQYIRLNMLRKHVQGGRLSHELRWKNKIETTK